MCEAAQGRFSFAEKIGGRRLTRGQAINNNSGVSRMRRKTGFLIGAAFLLVSCASSVKRAAMSISCIDALERTDIQNAAEAADRRGSAPKTYYLSRTVIYRPLGANKNGAKFLISRDGKLKTRDALKNAQIVIRKDFSGTLLGFPEKQNGKYFLKADFNNFVLEFAEGDNGFFYLITPSINYCGYDYVRDSAANCALQYK